MRDELLRGRSVRQRNAQVQGSRDQEHSRSVGRIRDRSPVRSRRDPPPAVILAVRPAARLAALPANATIHLSARHILLPVRPTVRAAAHAAAREVQLVVISALGHLHTVSTRQFLPNPGRAVGASRLLMIDECWIAFLA